MKRSKVIISILVVLAVISLGVNSFLRSHRHELLSDSELLGLVISKKIKRVETHREDVLFGAAALIEGNLKGAKHHFLRAQKHPDPHPSLNSLLALTAYLEARRAEFFHYYDQEAHHSLSPLLTALAHYLRSDYAATIAIFENSIPCKYSENDRRNSSCDFFDLVAHLAFSESLKKAHFIHALIEERQFATARQWLANTTAAPQNALGLLCDLKEAVQLQKEPQSESANHHYELVASKMSEPILSSINGAIEESLHQAMIASLLQPTTPLKVKELLLCHLQKNDDSALEATLTYLASRFDIALPLHCDSLTSFFERLLQKRKERAQTALHNGQIDVLNDYLNHYPELVDSELKQAFKERIAILCFSNLDQMQNLCELASRHEFAHTLCQDLVDKGQILWKSEDRERDATLLFEIACHYATSSQRFSLLKQIHSYLQNLFSAAQAAYLVKRLTVIHEMASHLSLPLPITITRENVANTVADAEHFFNKNCFTQAKWHAQWALCCDPTNETANYLLGASSFYLGEHRVALRVLRQLKTKNEVTQQLIFQCRTACCAESLAQGEDEVE